MPTQFTSKKKEAQTKRTYLKNFKVEGQTESIERESERRLCREEEGWEKTKEQHEEEKKTSDRQ